MYSGYLNADILYIINSFFLPTQCIIVSCINLRSNGEYCITETECVYCAVRSGSLYIILRSAHTVYLCVLCGYQNKQRLFLYTALNYRFLKPKYRVLTARYGLGL
jgi:hypothetical protein